MLTFSDWVAGAAAIVIDILGFPEGFRVRKTKLETRNKCSATCMKVRSHYSKLAVTGLPIRKH